VSHNEEFRLYTLRRISSARPDLGRTRSTGVGGEREVNSRSEFENLKERDYMRNLDVDDTTILRVNLKEMRLVSGLDANGSVKVQRWKTYN
jgi:hypothetical protein